VKTVTNLENFQYTRAGALINLFAGTTSRFWRIAHPISATDGTETWGGRRDASATQKRQSGRTGG